MSKKLAHENNTQVLLVLRINQTEHFRPKVWLALTIPYNTSESRAERDV